jgi:hypothetical protein
MKEFVIPIPSGFENNFFFMIRNKNDIIRLLMNTLKYVSSHVEIHGEIDSHLIIKVDDMNRFIYVSPDKIFSIRSPFNVREIDGELFFYTASTPEINSAMTSCVLAFIEENNNSSDCIYKFIDLYEESFEGYEEQAWSLIYQLMIFEDGYLRYDHDPKRADARIHPINHLDVYYTNACTFKIGTYHKPDKDYFMQLLNNKIESKYLEKR